MDKEKIKERIDFNKIKEIATVLHNVEIKYDYLVDSEEKPFIRLRPLDVKIIEILKDLENRIKELEK